MALQHGTILKNKWTIDAPLGSGGMATVYSATHRNGSRVAIKMLHSDVSKIDDMRGRFLREGYAANAVEHPGVVRVYDDDVAEDGAVFLVMELLEGEPLDVFWKRNGRKLPEQHVLTIADQMLDVLVAAHGKGIIHRDVKPQNIFLMKSGELKILDFGIARLLEKAVGSRATVTGAFMGTPAYVPPEQARARWDLVDCRSDLWAVGATMFVLLTGKLVHVAGTMNEQLLAAMTQSAPKIAGLRPDLPECIQNVVDRALEYERDKRWPDARTMQVAVREALQVYLAGGTRAMGRETIALPTQVLPRKENIDKRSITTNSGPKTPTTPSIEVHEISAGSASILAPSTPPGPTGRTETPIVHDVGLTSAHIVTGTKERTKFIGTVVGIPILMILGAGVFWLVTNRMSTIHVHSAATIPSGIDRVALENDPLLVRQDEHLVPPSDSRWNLSIISLHREMPETIAPRVVVSGAKFQDNHAAGLTGATPEVSSSGPIASTSSSAASSGVPIAMPVVASSAPILEPPGLTNAPTPSASPLITHTAPIPTPTVVHTDEPLED